MATTMAIMRSDFSILLSGLVRGGHIAGEVGSWHRVGQDILRVVGHGLGGEHHLDIVGGPGVEHLDVRP